MLIGKMRLGSSFSFIFIEDISCLGFTGYNLVILKCNGFKLEWFALYNGFTYICLSGFVGTLYLEIFSFLFEVIHVSWCKASQKVNETQPPTKWSTTAQAHQSVVKFWFIMMLDNYPLCHLPPFMTSFIFCRNT